MYFYKDNNYNLIKSSRKLISLLLLPITEEEYNAEIELLKKTKEVVENV